jgi:hypothetical protein
MPYRFEYKRKEGWKRGELSIPDDKSLSLESSVGFIQERGKTRPGNFYRLLDENNVVVYEGRAMDGWPPIKTEVFVPMRGGRIA